MKLLYRQRTTCVHRSRSCGPGGRERRLLQGVLRARLQHAWPWGCVEDWRFGYTEYTDYLLTLDYATL